MNILGDPFRDYVKKQVETRQRVLGKQYDISTSDLQYYNSKTPWLRLASSVDLSYGGGTIDPKSMLYKLKDKLEIPIEGGADLARKFILFGGSIDISFKEKVYGPDSISYDVSTEKFQGLSKGIYDSTTSTIFNSSYGWGGIDDRGFVPMPGITQASVQYLNNGALAKTTINIKCFSKKQMALVDALYLHPGYTLLLEFGWSMYLDDNGKVVNYDDLGFNSPALEFLFNPSGDGNIFYNLYQKIEDHKKETKGNYEGIVGRITKFKWSFNRDGSYDCQVDLLSYGSIIESLRINNETTLTNQEIVNYNKQFSEPTTVYNERTNLEEDSGIVGRLLKALSPPQYSAQSYYDSGRVTAAELDKVNAEKLKKFTTLNQTRLGQELALIYINYAPIVEEKDEDRKDRILPYTLDNFINPKNNFSSENIIIYNGIFIGAKHTTDSERFFPSSPDIYITFGTLLAIIQSKILLNNYVDNKAIPLFYFDFDFNNLDNDQNFITRFPGQLSGKPSNILVPFDEHPSELGIPYEDAIVDLDTIAQAAKYIESNFRGRLANVYINLNFIAETLKVTETTQNADTEVFLKDFLDRILNEIQVSLGGINDIQTIIDNATGAIRFIDRSPVLINDQENEERYTRFNIFGVLPGSEGSFVRDLTLDSELTNEYATQMSIGASSGKNIGNAGAFSLYNLGMKDRIIPIREYYSQGAPEETTLQKIQKLWKEKDMLNIIKEVYENKNFSSENIDSLSSSNSQLSKLIISYLQEQTYIPPSSVLPFNLSLDLDGISGMRLFEKFYIDNRVLPPNYEEDQVNILIKGINHTVTPTAWTTKLETLYAPNLANPKKLQPSSNTPTSTGVSNAEYLPKLIFSTPPPSGGDINSRRKAMEKSFNWVFSNNGEISDLCSRYSYNLALKYVNALRGKSLEPKENIRSGGDANQIGLQTSIVRLGYILQRKGQNVSKVELVDIINNTTWEYGDIIIYNPIGIPGEVGHVQIYVGDINNSKWASSKKENYGSSFVYNNKDWNKYNVYVGRAPSL